MGGKGWLSTGPSEHLQTEQKSFEALSLSWGQGRRRGWRGVAGTAVCPRDMRSPCPEFPSQPCLHLLRSVHPNGPERSSPEFGSCYA